MLIEFLFAQDEKTCKKKFLILTFFRFFVYPVYLYLMAIFNDLNNPLIFANFSHPYLFIYSKTLIAICVTSLIVYFIYTQALKKSKNGLLTTFIGLNFMGLMFTVFFLLRSLIGATDESFFLHFKEHLIEFILTDIVLIPAWLYFAFKVRKINLEIQQMESLIHIVPKGIPPLFKGH